MADPETLPGSAPAHDSHTDEELYYALNPKYKDGTRLRSAARADATFNGVWVPNDTALLVLAWRRHSPAGSSDSERSSASVTNESSVGGENDWALVRKRGTGEEGWIRARNLSRVQRHEGVTRDVPHNAIVTPDPEYCQGMRIYGVGIKQDPVGGGCKRGKGVQHLVSAFWVSEMAVFIAHNFVAMQEFLRHAYTVSETHPGYDFLYLLNTGNYLFNKADVMGLRSEESRDYYLMANWLVMAAAEVDDFPFGKYTPAERRVLRERFYAKYLKPTAGPGTLAASVSDHSAAAVPAESREDATKLGKYAAPYARVDLLPMLAMERLSVNNELSALKYVDAEQPLREGFLLSQRTDSLKRHFEAAHSRHIDEDHIIHLCWNFMAIFHVLTVFPHQNDLIDFEELRRHAEEREGSTSTSTRVKGRAYIPTTSLEKIGKSGRSIAGVLKLDWNEGVVAPPRSVQQALLSVVVQDEGHRLKWYPELGGGKKLQQMLAKFTNTVEENILVTNGSDDALILICQTFLRSGLNVVAPVPTYEHFCVNAVGSGATLIRLEVSDVLDPCEDEISAAVEKHRCRVAYLVSPNNPTGVQWPEETVRRLAIQHPKTIFVVDEAYYEFGRVEPGHEEPITCARLATQLENVIVTRTFSKAFCLAAVRCGYLIAHPNTVELLRVRYNPKSVNSFAQVAACAALEEYRSYYRPYIFVINEQRERFAGQLREHGFSVKNAGAGNFVSIEMPDGNSTTEWCEHLEAQDVYVRDISGRWPGHIRVSVGESMDRVLQALLDCRAASAVKHGTQET